MATEATNAPTFHPNPTSAAKADVTKIESTTPRSVFEGPNSGLPSREVQVTINRRRESFAEDFCSDYRGAVGDREQS